MVGLFVGIALVTASITSGILFYFAPPVSSVAKKEAVVLATVTSPVSSTAAIALESEITPTPIQSGITPSMRITLSSQPLPLGNADLNSSLVSVTGFLPPAPAPTITLPEITTTSKLSLANIRVSPTSTPLVTLVPTTPIAPSIINDSNIPSPTQIPAITNAPTGGLNAGVLFQLVNDYRNKMGLSELEKDDKTCTIASQRAPQIYNEIYGAGTMHAGLKRMQLPYWITENIISMNTELKAFDWWIHDAIHRQAIEGNYTNSCVACSGNSCSEVFTSFVPK